MLQSAIRSQGRVRDLELALRSKSGESRQALIGAETAEMAGEPCFIAIIRDLTDQRRAEREVQERQRELAHLSRVATLGELSGALAHELSQPLTAMLTNAEAAQRMLGQQPIDIEEVREILSRHRAPEHARRRSHLAPARIVQERRDAVPAARPQRSGDRGARAGAWRSHRSWRQRARPASTTALPAVNGDRIQLQQVLLNLIHNACEAMSEVPPSRAQAHRDAAKQPPSGWCRSAVCDSGPGVTAALRERLFEPFFTTKTHGLGLGLSITRSIIASHGGRLWVSNHPARGAMFCFTIPVKE